MRNNWKHSIGLLDGTHLKERRGSGIQQTGLDLPTIVPVRARYSETIGTTTVGNVFAFPAPGRYSTIHLRCALAAAGLCCLDWNDWKRNDWKQRSVPVNGARPKDALARCGVCCLHQLHCQRVGSFVLIDGVHPRDAVTKDEHGCSHSSFHLSFYYFRQRLLLLT